ncbi:unnamed protein product [Danaus chrysippus]|uniref:(African queen) hypothetical protein n=1 Tax=Danaus chrysippus TaxID=151541 RepID=A0A8J2W661_9NEOP|nr:unnamed protein product [Danaus chrysippus]
MTDINSLFDCFEEPALNEAATKLPNVKSEEETPATKTEDVKKEQSIEASPSNKRPHEEVQYADTSKKLRQEEEDDSDIISDINLNNLGARILIHTLDTHEGCTHEVAIPPNQEYAQLMPITSEPAKQYSFILDPFQKEAIMCIDNLQSVLVSAHTSAGKTVVAEYAIALSLKNKQRVIYTTPIKALSNQKYREFSEEFHDVGLITGDVTINPSASCLIMTTEILRNMLYRGSEIMREVGWVVFDEIHYMRDKERGVVWEETLILLPDNPCHVIYTEYRPTPLQHYIFPASGDGIHLVVDEKGQFKEDNFNTAMTVLSNAGGASSGG